MKHFILRRLGPDEWVVGSNPARVACGFFSQPLGKHWLYNICISQYPLLYRNLTCQSSPGKLSGREVKTSALVSRRSWVRILPKSPVDFFHRHSAYTVLYTLHCCKGKIWSIVYHPTQEFHQSREKHVVYTNCMPRPIIYRNKRGLWGLLFDRFHNKWIITSNINITKQ